MVTLDCTASAHDGVTLVTVRLHDIDVPTRVRVESRLDGPVWPPRREGLPEPGWTDDGFAGVVGPGTDALGYATPAPPADPPAVLVDAEPVPDADPREELTTDPESVVRQLGDPAPPADAVPTRGDGLETDPGPQAAAASGKSTAESSQFDDPPTGAEGDTSAEALGPDDTEPTQLPSAVGPWLAEMTRRVDHAERLADAETVPEATEAVRAVGGLTAVRDLVGDEQQLRAVARRARRLADRRAAATVPVDTLDTLA